MRHGTCPSFDATNLNAVHGDCIHTFGDVNLYVARNNFHRCDVQGLFLENGVNGGAQISGLVENDYFSDFTESNKCGVCIGAVNSVSWTVRNNSFDTTASFRAGSGNPNDSGDFTVTGNVVPDAGANGGQFGSCNPPGMVFHWSYNVWNASANAPINCGSPTVAVSNFNSLFVDSTPGSGDGNLDLASSSSAPNGFMASGCPAVDFHGTPRSTPCDSGGDEKP